MSEADRRCGGRYREGMTELTRVSFAAMVDHTLLAPTATAEQVRSLCSEALDLRTASVCVNGAWVALVAAELAGSDVKTCSVVGFPLGAMSSNAMAHETVYAVADGATEIDMVIPIGLIKSGDTDGASACVGAVRSACPDATLKVILETAVLTDDEIRSGCDVAEAQGAEFVKTSTGFNAAGGATQAAVELMESCVGGRLGIKASGGIRSLDDVRTMVAAGATRLGMSSTTAVANELS